MSSGPVMLDLKGPELLPEEAEMLAHPAAGGVILFSRNYESPEQLQELVASIRASRQPPLLIAVDQEGGRVQRFQEGFSRLPAPAAYARWQGGGRTVLRERVRDAGWLMASELRARGIDFSFAPVLDVDRGISEVIGDRAFSDDPEWVASLAYSWCRGANDAGMASVGKHFPGHGAVADDSHRQLPVDPRSLDAILENDLYPFHHLIDNGLQGVMPAHLVYPDCDPDPAGYSRFWLQDILRQRLGFGGAIFSDDLSMAAAELAGSFADRAAMALQAGCDMILVCNSPEGAAETLDSLAGYRNPVSQARLLPMHGKGRVDIHRVREDIRWQRTLRFFDDLADDREQNMEFGMQ